MQLVDRFQEYTEIVLPNAGRVAIASELPSHVNLETLAAEVKAFYGDRFHLVSSDDSVGDGGSDAASGSDNPGGGQPVSKRRRKLP